MKKFLFTIAVSITATASAQINIDMDINPEDPVGINAPIKLSNNGRVLTTKGAALIKNKHLESVTVTATRDTFILTLKPEAIKLLDSDKKANYQSKGGSKEAIGKKQSKSHKK